MLVAGRCGCDDGAERHGPLPSYPFGAADHQLAPQDLRPDGYVEEDYFLSGKASVYSWPAPGPAVG